MALTFKEEQIFRKQIELMKFEQQLANIVPTQPVLAPSKDTEISTLQQQIKAEEVHIKRSDYIKKVQPMKNSLKELIAQNKQIEADNKAALNTVHSIDESMRQVIINNISAAKNEMNILLGGI